MYVVDSLRRAETKASSLPLAARVNALLYGLAVLGLALVTLEVRSGASTVRQVQAFPSLAASTTVVPQGSPYAPAPPALSSTAGGAPVDTAAPAPAAAEQGSGGVPISTSPAGAADATPGFTITPGPTPSPAPAANPSITFVPQSQLQGLAQSQPQLPAFTIPPSSNQPSTSFRDPAPVFTPLPPLPAPASAGPVTVTAPAPLVIQPPNIAAPATPAPVVVPLPQI